MTSFSQLPFRPVADRSPATTWPGKLEVGTHHSGLQQTLQPQFNGILHDGARKLFGPIQKTASAIMHNDSSRVIAEDILGFGLFRTTFDLFRGFFYANSSTDAEKLNLSLARERVIREMGNLFATNFLSGLTIFGLIKGVHALGVKTLGTRFINLETQEVFRHFTGSHHQNTSPNEFIGNIAHYMAGNQPEKAHALNAEIQAYLNATAPEKRLADLDQLKATAKNVADADLAKILSATTHTPQAVENVINKAAHHIHDLAGKSKTMAMWQPLAANVTTQADLAEHHAKKIVHTLAPQQTHFDLTRTLPSSKYAHTFSAKELLSDIRSLLDATHTGSTHTGPINHFTTTWAKKTHSLLNRTRRFSRWSTPLAYAAGFVFTVLVPILNKQLTEKIDKTQSYPGIKGLMEMKPVDHNQKPWWEKLAPYLTEQTRQGNLIPLLATLAPMPLAFGLVNNAALRAGNFSKVWNNPFTQGGARKLLRLFQFRKGFPYVSIQQIAALCATVMSARLLTVRDGLEMRERFVDTYAGWLLWIPVIPNIQRIIAKRLDKAKGTDMIKHKGMGGVFREKSEMAHFLPKNVAEKTISTFGRLNKWTFAAMVFMLGIVEPYVAIKWTEQQAKSLRKDDNEKKWSGTIQTLTQQSPHYVGSDTQGNQWSSLTA